MVYSRRQEQLASWIWITVMAIMGVSAVCGTVRAVRDISRLGVSIVTVSILLLFAGIALIGLSAAVSSLLFILSPSSSEKRPRWFLLALCIGLVMSILGIGGVFY